MKTPTQIVRQCVQGSLHPHGFPLNYTDGKMTFLVKFIMLTYAKSRSVDIKLHCSLALMYSLSRA